MASTPKEEMSKSLHSAYFERRPTIGARLCNSTRQKTLGAMCVLSLFLVWPSRSLAHDEWYRGLDLESALADSGLVLVGRVADVSETKLGVGGKGERSLLQYKFEPVSVLK